MTNLTPRPGHVVAVSELPLCDICQSADATWDSPTVFGPWANTCDECNRKVGANFGHTGVGIGQRLVLRTGP